MLAVLRTRLKILILVVIVIVIVIPGNTYCRDDAAKSVFRQIGKSAFRPDRR